MYTAVRLQVEAKVLGRPAAAVHTTLPLALPDATSPCLRDLLAALVRHEVEAFHQRQAEQRLLQVLTPTPIDQGAEAGRIVPGGRTPQPEADAGAAVATAL